MKSHKFWTEPRPCMVLGLKPMGKPSTKKKSYKFWTEPRPCMVLGLKPMGKPTISKKKLLIMAHKPQNPSEDNSSLTVGSIP